MQTCGCAVQRAIRLLNGKRPADGPPRSDTSLKSDVIPTAPLKEDPIRTSAPDRSQRVRTAILFGRKVKLKPQAVAATRDAVRLLQRVEGSYP
jgi:hypothetical protein